MKELKGFVILSPESIKGIPEWDLAHRTFGLTPVEAWTRLIGLHQDEHPTKIQRLHDRGFRLRNATLTITD